MRAAKRLGTIGQLLHAPERFLARAQIRFARVGLARGQLRFDFGEALREQVRDVDTADEILPLAANDPEHVFWQTRNPDHSPQQPRSR